jgi:hypothetical protein
MPPKFYNLADQKLFENYQYLPQEKYRLGLTLPTDTSDDVVTDEGIVNTNAFANTGGGGGDGFSVYNPDPNTIVNQNYDDKPYQTALTYNEAFPMMGDPVANIATGALNADGYMGLSGDDDEELTGIRSLVSKGVNLIPGMGMVNVGLNALSNLLPINERAIYENELAGQGIMVNDIGQIVASPGNINTAQNIMAGYNANMIDADTIQDRINTINEKMSDTVNPETGKTFKQEKIDALNEFAEINNIALDRKDIIFDYRKKQKDKYDVDPTTTDGNPTTTDGSGDYDDNNQTDTGPVGPQFNDPGYADPGVDAEENQPGGDNDGGQGEGPQENNNNNNDGPYGGGPGGIHSNYMYGGRVKYFYGGKV